MKQKFMDVVPKGAQVTAWLLMGAMAAAGALGGYFVLWGDDRGFGHLGPIGCAALCLVGGLVWGAFVAAWVLCLGYVYADARRRGMRPVLWTLIAALFPHLFGFLLYFALRQSLTPRCGGCGQPMGPEQRFCSWCGSARPPVDGVGQGAAGMGPAATV
ncbi:MAG: hypothetical protein WBY53_15890 [Acidobacteriaceae bacterium]